VQFRLVMTGSILEGIHLIVITSAYLSHYLHSQAHPLLKN
jgi:hypothetical protein